MKVIKFPENKIRRKWARKLQNADKNLTLNFVFSLVSMVVGLVIVWFVLHKMNS